MNTSSRCLFAAAMFAASLMIAASAHAADHPYEISVVSNAFEPAQLTIPAGKRVSVLVHNKTTMPVEFESYDFTAEKVVPGGTSIPVYIGPLKPGSYKFFNDFADGVKGQLLVK